MITVEHGTATVTLEPLTTTRTAAGVLTVTYNADDLLWAVVAVLQVAEDSRAEALDALATRPAQ